MKSIEHYWYHQNLVSWLLLPLAGLYCLLISLRIKLYQLGWLKSYRAPIPVIVVGNLTVGGTDKTPLIIWLTRWLKSQGLRPGIISRGYGSKAGYYPYEIKSFSTAEETGDEPLLLQNRTGVPVVIGPDRQADIEKLLAEHDCNIILSDDGLQHYRLQRDIEIAIVDGTRGFGNGFCLPSGPLREPVTRLNRVDMIMVNGGGDNQLAFKVIPGEVYSVGGSCEQLQLDAFAGQKVHAVAGIGNPQRFFDLLQQHQVEIIPHVFRDHHQYHEYELDFADELPVLMTEKDAVKCRRMQLKNLWYLDIDIQLSDIAKQRLQHLLEQVQDG